MQSRHLAMRWILLPAWWLAFATAAYAVQMTPLGPTQLSVYAESVVSLRVAIARDATQDTRTDNCSLHWDITPAAPLPTNGTATLFIPPNTLQPGTSYAVQATAQCPEGNASVAFGVNVLQHPAPAGGGCSVMPAQGTALDTPFQISTVGWQNTARTALFLRKPDGQLQPLSTWLNGPGNQVMAQLPWFGVSPLTVECHADNGYGAQSVRTTTVRLAPPGPQYQVIAQCSPSRIEAGQPLQLRAMVQPKPGASVAPTGLRYHWSPAPAASVNLPEQPTVMLDGGQTAQMRPTIYTFTVTVADPSGKVTAKCQAQVAPAPARALKRPAAPEYNGRPVLQK